MKRWVEIAHTLSSGLVARKLTSSPHPDFGVWEQDKTSPATCVVRHIMWGKRKIMWP